jgi:DEP domain-containing protein 5
MTNDEVLLTKVRHSVCHDVITADFFSLCAQVDTKDYQATYVEFSFGDQYLGRNDMWRLTEHLEGSCVHVGQEVTFIGAIAAKVMSIYVDGKSVCVYAITGNI